MGRSFFVDDAAALLGVSRRTVYYLIRDGKLRTIRTLCGSQRVLLESLEELLRARVPTPRPAAASDTRPSGQYPELQRRRRLCLRARAAPRRPSRPSRAGA